MSDLRCDFDCPTFPCAFARRLGAVVRVHRLRVVYVRYDRTARGWHVHVELSSRVSFARQVQLQAILGSDWKRELFNSRRAVAWRRVPVFWRERANVLYQRHYRGIAL